MARHSNSESFVESRRATHNALERKRRIFQKERLTELRDAVPSLKTEKPSTVEILESASEHIGALKLRHLRQEREVAALCGENITLTKDLLGKNADGQTKGLNEQLDFLERVRQMKSRVYVRLTGKHALPSTSSNTTTTTTTTSTSTASGMRSPGRKRAHTFSVGESVKRVKTDGPEMNRYDSATAEDAQLMADFFETVRKNSVSLQLQQQQSKQSDGNGSNVTTTTTTTITTATESEGDVDGGVSVSASRAPSCPPELNTERTTQQQEAAAGGEAADRRRLTTLSVMEDGGDDEEEDEDEALRDAVKQAIETGFGDEEDDDEQDTAEQDETAAKSDVATSGSGVRRVRLAEDQHDSAEEPACACGKPWDGRFMVHCVACQHWFHGDCVGVLPRRVPPQWRCENCLKVKGSPKKMKE